jgi:hypothetical protein
MPRARCAVPRAHSYGGRGKSFTTQGMEGFRLGTTRPSPRIALTADQLKHKVLTAFSATGALNCRDQPRCQFRKDDEDPERNVGEG